MAAELTPISIEGSLPSTRMLRLDVDCQIIGECGRAANVVGRTRLALIGPKDSSVTLEVDPEMNPASACPAIPLSLDTTTTIENFADAKDLMLNPCGTNHPEVVFELDIPEPSNLEVEVEGQSGSRRQDFYVYLRDSCPDGQDLGCRDVIRDVPPGKYFLAVEAAEDPVATSARVTVRRTTRSAWPSNTSCDRSQAIAFDGNNSAVLSVEYSPQFTSVWGHQQFWRLDLSKPAVFDGLWATDAAGFYWLLLQSDCSTPFDPCPALLQPGTYYVRATIFDARAKGEIHLFLSEPSESPASARCEGAQLIPSDVGLHAAEGNFSAEVELSSVCLDEKSAYLRLDLRARSDLTILEHDGIAALSVFRGACDRPDFVATCGLAGDQLLGLAPGPLWIRAPSTAELSCAPGRFRLEYQITASPPAPSNDTCLTASQVEFPGLHAPVRIEGSFRGASFDITERDRSACTLAADLFYALQVPERSLLYAAFESGDGRLALGADCAHLGVSSCQSEVLTVVPPGELRLFVGGLSSQEFVLRLELLDTE